MGYHFDSLLWLMSHYYESCLHDSLPDMITHLKQQSKYRLVKYRLLVRALIGLLKGLRVKSDWCRIWPWVTSSDLPWIWPESVVQFRPTTVWQASRLIDCRTKLLTIPSSCLNITSSTSGTSKTGQSTTRKNSTDFPPILWTCVFYRLEISLRNL